MSVFYLAMQLKSDGDDAVSNDEIRNLLELMQLSSITSRDSSIVQDSMTSDNNWDQMKQIASRVAFLLREHFNRLHEENKGIMSVFDFWPLRRRVNTTNEIFRIYVKFFKNSEDAFEFYFRLEKDKLVFTINSANELVKKFVLEIFSSSPLSNDNQYRLVNEKTDSMTIWEKPIQDWNGANITDNIFESIKNDMDIILPQLVNKVHEVLTNNPLRIEFINKLREMIFRKISGKRENWVIEGDNLIGARARILVHQCEISSGEGDGGYGSWWACKDIQSGQGIPLNLKEVFWEGLTINGVNDFKDYGIHECFLLGYAIEKRWR